MRSIYLGLIVLSGVIFGILLSKYYETTRLNASPLLSEAERNEILKELRQFKDNSSQFIKLVKLVRSSVVSISTKKVLVGYEDDFFGWFSIPRRFETSQIGSGVIVDKNGYIITNNHIVQGMDEIKVVLDDGREFTGKVVGGDSVTDIAVVKIKTSDLQPAILGDSDKIEIGEVVLAIGSPFGLGQSVTSGIISAKRNLPVSSRRSPDYPDFIQTDAAINPGNSGGPLVSLSGEVIGINSFIITRSGGFQGVGFAIPINRAKYIMEQILEKGKILRPFLGVSTTVIDEALSYKYGFNSLDKFLNELKIDKPTGVFILEVIGNSPAQEAKLREGNIILEYNNKPITSSDELYEFVNKSKIGEKVNLKILRNGKEKMITVSIGERK
jgi:serine protease Do